MSQFSFSRGLFPLHLGRETCSAILIRKGINVGADLEGPFAIRCYSAYHIFLSSFSTLPGGTKNRAGWWGTLV